MTVLPIRRALLSVSDKAGIVDLGEVLAAAGVTLLSTGGTAKALREAGLDVIDVSAVTGFPEIMDGRVKTLHPLIHGGLLAKRDDPAHRDAMTAHGIEGIDLLVVNLYPFEATVASGADPTTCVENIDIGGPAMIRAAAKNHADVAVVVDPADYAGLDRGTTLDQRQALAGKAYAHTAAYDAAIAAWFADQRQDPMPAVISMAGRRVQTLRYGENPHQSAAFYRIPDAQGHVRPGVATAVQVQGKALSYNNLNDTDAAFECVADLDQPACAIIKHANPCGVAVGATVLDAYEKALRCDPVSAFGGIVAVNQPLDSAMATAITQLFTEVVIAPDADDAAKAAFAAKKNLRLLLTGAMPDPQAPGMTVRSVAGGLLLQDRDAGRVSRADLKVVTERAPTEAEWADLLLAFRVVKHVKSNAIVYVKDGATVGIGAGQMSRVDSSRIAARKAQDAAEAARLPESLAKGSVVASDAFFPFADGLLAAVEAGATAVIQPGGSVRDTEVIEAADAHGLAMVLTGMRHFRH